MGKKKRYKKVKESEMTFQEIKDSEMKKARAVLETMKHHRVSPGAVKAFWTAQNKNKPKNEQITLDQAAEMYKKLPSDSEYRKALGDGSTEKYGDKLSKILQDMHDTYGIKRFKDIEPYMVSEMIQKSNEAYNNGKTTEAGRSNDIVAALNALNLGVKHTNQSAFGKEATQKMDFGDIQDLRKMRKDDGVQRNPGQTAGLKATQDMVNTVAENLKKDYDKKGNKFTRAAYVALRITQYSGARHSAALGFRPENIVIVENGKPTFHYPPGGDKTNRKAVKQLIENEGRFANVPDGIYTQVVDKGGKHNFDKVLKEGEQFFKDLLKEHYSNPQNYTEKGKLKDVKFLDIRKENGEEYTKKYIRQRGSQAIRKHASQFDEYGKIMYKTKDEDGKTIHKMSQMEINNFTEHAARRAFALGKGIDEYKSLTGTPEERKGVFNLYRELDPKTIDKYNEINGAKVKESSKLENNPVRESQLFVSFSLDHYRESITNSYVNEDNLRDALKKMGILKEGH